MVSVTTAFPVDGGPSQKLVFTIALEASLLLEFIATLNVSRTRQRAKAE
jgi:hypothetical protein